MKYVFMSGNDSYYDAKWENCQSRSILSKSDPRWNTESYTDTHLKPFLELFHLTSIWGWSEIVSISS